MLVIDEVSMMTALAWLKIDFSVVFALFPSVTFYNYHTSRFLLWRRFESEILLKESVRFGNNPEWGEGCAASRIGKWVPAFIKLINLQLVHDDDNETWSKDRVFVTPDYSTRPTINHEFIKATVKLLPSGKYPIREVAQFDNSLSGLQPSWY
ncbi:hypothetical protein PHMEG_00019158 [Phytophthora megakarya]|uniref:Uncharacterized protein n=1 Tax=Phytophthora megakarya TaxID=4795 RepID=A0A225VTR5_9STRA|nr:hypothetical protein PHMEG_00019158 [Phytophthora megakarya]